MLGFLSALLVKTSFQFCLFLTFFYLDSGGLISCISKPGCSVISKRYYSDVSGLFFFFYLFNIYFFFLSFLSLLLPHFDSPQFCSLLCARALSSQSGLYYFHLLHLPSPSSWYSPSRASVSVFPDALSPFQLFSLPCCLHCSCWPHPSADPLKSVSYMDENASPPEAASRVGESARQEGSSGSYAFRTSKHRGFEGPDST